MAITDDVLLIEANDTPVPGCTRGSLLSAGIFTGSALLFITGFCTKYMLAASGTPFHMGLFEPTLSTLMFPFPDWWIATQALCCIALIIAVVVGMLFILPVFKPELSPRVVILARSILILSAAGWVLLAVVVYGLMANEKIIERDQSYDFYLGYSYWLLVVSGIGYLVAGILSVVYK